MHQRSNLTHDGVCHSWMTTERYVNKAPHEQRRTPLSKVGHPNPCSEIQVFLPICGIHIQSFALHHHKIPHPTETVRDVFPTEICPLLGGADAGWHVGSYWLRFPRERGRRVEVWGPCPRHRNPGTTGTFCQTDHVRSHMTFSSQKQRANAMSRMPMITSTYKRFA